MCMKNKNIEAQAKFPGCYKNKKSVLSLMNLLQVIMFIEKFGLLH